MTPAAASGLIIDTDYGQYTEDAAAVAIAHYMVINEETNILGFIIPNTSLYAPGALDALNTYYGYGTLPIANYKGDPLFADAAFAQESANTLNNDMTAGIASDPNVLYRRLLEQAPAGSVKIVVIGHQTTFAEFLQEADGPALVSAAVSEVVVMGGKFPSGIEGNIVRDMAAADYVAQNCPVPIVYCGSEVVEAGDGVRNGADLTTLTPATNPVRVIYEQQTGTSTPTYCWDEMTVLYAVRGLAYGGDTYFARVRGTATFSTVSGNCTWANDANGNHYYLVKAQADSFYEDLLGTMLYWAPI